MSSRDLCSASATRGRPASLERTLESLANCRDVGEVGRTVVVENGGRLGAEEVVRRAPAVLKVEYLYQPVANKSVALNSVLRSVGKCLVFFTDDDVRVSPDTLAAYLAAWDGRASGAFYGGPVGVDYDREPPEWLKAYLPPSARGWSWTGPARPVTRPVFLGANWAALAEDLRAAGGFDPARGSGSRTAAVGSETEMQARLLRRGIEGVYVPGAVVWHHVPEDRCSIRWALHRVYRGGVARGMDYVSDVSSVWGMPRWAIREWMMRGLRLALGFTHAEPSERFRVRYEWREWSGFLAGCRVARKSR